MFTKSPLFLLILFITYGAYSQSIEDSLNLELNNLSQENALVGFAVAIMNQDDLIYSKGFGYANLEKQIPYATSTVQPIASISKTLIGVSLMKAQEMGKLKIDDDINKYLPFKIVNPNFPNKAITIRHLANHTSSLKDSKHYQKSYIFKNLNTQTEFPSEFKKQVKRFSKNEDLPQTDFLKNIYHPQGEWYSENHFLDAAPGEKYAYSNNGAALASLVLSQATGMDYLAFTKKYILEALDMKSSGWSLDNYKAAEKSKQYMGKVAIPEFKLITIADGGFITSVEDFSKYLRTIMKGFYGEDNILTAQSYAAMMKENINFNKGIFWNTKAGNNPSLIGHSGGDPGVTTFMFIDQRSSLGYVFFSNTSNAKSIEGDMVAIIKTLVKFGPRLNEEKSKK